MYYDDFYFLHEEELFSDVFKTIYMYCSVLCLRLEKKKIVCQIKLSLSFMGKGCHRGFFFPSPSRETSFICVS